MKTYCLIIFLIFPLISKNLVISHPHFNQSVSIEDKLSDKLSKMAEFKSLTDQLSEKDEKAGIRPTIIIRSKPTKAYPYYEVSLGYDHPDRYQNVYTLRIRSNYVNNINLLPHLEVYDYDRFVSLLSWRKRNRFIK